MIGSNTGLTIPTGLVTDASVSNWAMKLTAVSGTHTPTILSDTEGPFTAYHTIPSTATKVVTYASNVDTSSSSEIKTTFAIGIDASQAADTYNGKVKFTLVHPSYANADGSVDTIEDITYMQEISLNQNWCSINLLMTWQLSGKTQKNRDTPVINGDVPHFAPPCDIHKRRLNMAEKEGFELVDDFATPSPKVPQSLMYQRFPSFSVFASSLQLPTKTFPVRLAIRLILRLAGRSTRVFS